MNALYLLGFAFVIGMMACEGNVIPGSPVAERSMVCYLDCSPSTYCHRYRKCLCYYRGDYRDTCVTQEEGLKKGGILVS
ncbi:hypothetical protein V5799_032086 [Amblyomma americanum]|uniref:Secreted protein n=1 Tax=Amblyomma americanum TaxID=6943 RepID=A0AAQ4DS64_AMBAM